MTDTEAPQISTLGPDDEDFVQRSSQSPKISTTTPSSLGKLRLSKIKLRVLDRPPNLEERSHTGSGGGGGGEDDEEEDQLIDDDLGISNNQPSSVPLPKPKRTRKGRAKGGNLLPAAPSPEIPHPTDDDPQILIAMESEDVSAPSGERKTMMSAWQVQVPNVTPTPGGTSDVWDSHEPAKKKPVRKAGTPSSQPKPKRAAPKKLDEIASVEGTPQPGAPSTPKHETPQEVTLDDVQHFADTGLLSLAPSRPLPLRPFPVQSIPRGFGSCASIGPLDRSKNKPRKWQITHRELRTISGGRWIARTWVGDKESGLVPPITDMISGIADGTPGTPGSATNVKPAKHPKIRLIQSKASGSRGSPLASAPKDTDSRRSSEIPRTREPSLDTEMLSLAGDDPPKQGRGGDMDVDEFLGESSRYLLLPEHHNK